MADLQNVIVPKKEGTARWLYELLRDLQQRSSSASAAIAAVGRGEAPDGSGNPLLDLSDFFFLPGRTTGQIGFGSTEANGTLTLSSTSHADKGFIYFGYPSHRMALDEDQGFFGIGTDTPGARLHITTTALGTSTVGALGTAFARFTYAGTNKLDIAPLLNTSGVVDIALNVNSGSVQFVDADFGSAGFRIAFAASRTFLQAGRVNSSSVVINRIMTIGGMNATVGESLTSNFRFVNLTTTSEGAGGGGGAVSADDTMVAINKATGDYTSRASLLVGARTVGSVPQVIEQGSTTVNAFEYRHSSTGVSPTKVFGYLKFSFGPGLGSLTDQGSLIGYVSGTETVRLSPIASATLQWAFQSPAGLNQLGHILVASGAWGDSLAATTNRIDLGDVASSVRAVALTSSGGNIMSRFGISAVGTTIENTTLGGGAAGLSAPTAVLSIFNNATNGTDGTVLCSIRTNRALQSGNLLQFLNSIGTVLATVNPSGAWTGPINTTGSVTVTDLGFIITDFADPTRTVQFLVSHSTASVALGVTFNSNANRAMRFNLTGSAGVDLDFSWAGTASRTITIPDVTGTLATINNAQTFSALQTFDSIAAGNIVIEINTQIGGGTYGDGTSFMTVTDISTGFKQEWQVAAAGFTADRLLVLPNGSGEIVLVGATQSLSNKTMEQTCTMRSSTASAGVSFQDLTTSTKKLRMVLSGAFAGNNSFTFTGSGQAKNYGFLNLSGNVVTVGDDPPTVAAGALGKVDLTAQTADIGTTNLSNGPPTGVYMVEVYLMCTTAAAAAGTLAVTIGWTDNVGATTDNTSITAFPLTATGRAKAIYGPLRVNSGEITYAVAITGIYSTAQYAVYARVISLG